MVLQILDRVEVLVVREQQQVLMQLPQLIQAAVEEDQDQVPPQDQQEEPAAVEVVELVVKQEELEFVIQVEVLEVDEVQLQDQEEMVQLVALV